jgi:sterol desaturase/sphingolipid hydroxylase (fatty acid hydroxylase superfamily)
VNAVDQAVFEPSLFAFVRYVLGFAARYALICGGLYWGLYRKHLWPRFKIQPQSPTNENIRHEIIWSVSNTVCTGVFLLLMYWCIQNNHTRMYFDISERGWLWFFVSIPLGTIGFDTWFYWQHRALHTRWLFKHCHSVHHRVSNPTPFAAFAHHPVETLLEDTYFLLLIMVVPMHPLAFGVCGLHAFVLGVAGHMGYEFFPRGFTRHRIFGLHNTGTHHNMHHSHPRGNYSLYFNWWDQLMNTNHPEYHQYFDRIKNRQAEQAGQHAPRSAG